MKIRDVTLEPYEKSILPSIVFTVDISYTNYQEAIIEVDGWLKTDEGIIIASISRFPDESKKVSALGAKGTSSDDKFKEEIYKTKVIAQLNKEALDFIEERRMADEKGDVKLTLHLRVKYIESTAVVLESYLIAPKEIGLPEIPVQTSRRKESGKIVVYAYDPKFQANQINRWIISGDNGPIFLVVNEESLKKEDIRIPSTDWIHDYAPKLGIGEYFIVEIPKGKKIIKKAWGYVEKSEECFRNWDTKGVYANCREVGKLLDKIIKDKFKDSPTIKKWKRVIEKFNYSASLDLHIEDIKNENPGGDIKIGKAEAEHILIVTKALVKYAEELLEGNN